MRIVVIDARTGETTIIEAPEEEIPVTEGNTISSIEERVSSLEGTTEEIVVALNDKGLIP